jgi:hypothetical protein
VARERERERGSRSASRDHELPDVVYFRALAKLGLELDVEGRRLLHERIAGALRAKPLPRRVPPSGVLELKLEEIVEAVTKTVGGMLLKGASAGDVKEDYPFLKDEDLELATLFTVAYPRVGRPREAAPR